MSNVEQLPKELLWADGGHASDIALTTLADAQYEIIPREVIDHVVGCTACTAHLGNAALLSLHTARQMQIAKSAGALEIAPKSVKKRPLPRFAIALGLGVAGLGLVPSYLQGSLFGGASSFAHDLPLFARGLRSTVSHVAGTNIGLVFTWGAALVLSMMAVAVVRLLPKKETSR